MPSPNCIGQPFIELLSVGSTNNYAMGLARAGMAHHGTAVFTHEQTKGKGQRNKSWASEKDLNLALSVIIDPQALPPARVFMLSMMAAVAAFDFISGYVHDELSIKWPNDIYWRDRKAAGILIENLWQGEVWKCAVVGIGININQTDFGELGTKAVSLKQITGKHWQPLDLAKELCVALENNFQLLLRDEAAVQSFYFDRLYKRGQLVKLKKDNRIFTCTFTGVTGEGQMVVQHGIEEKFSVGEVEWIIEP